MAKLCFASSSRTCMFSLCGTPLYYAHRLDVFTVYFVIALKEIMEFTLSLMREAYGISAILQRYSDAKYGIIIFALHL